MTGLTNAWQAGGLLVAAGLGFLLGAVYDLLRILRSLTRQSAAAVFLQDVGFCLLAATAFFFCSLPLTGGRVRLYLLVGCGAGFGVWLTTVGRYSVRICRRLAGWLHRITRPVQRALAAVRSKMRQHLRKIHGLHRFFAEKSCKNRKKGLHNAGQVLYNDSNR